jgi:hypothetical protein
MTATKVVVQDEEEKRLGEARQVINSRPRTMLGSRQAEEEAWALAVAAHQEKEVLVVAEYPACQAMALL